MDVTATMSVVQTLCAALECSKLKEVCSVLGKKPKFNRLSNTVSDIRALLLDVKANREELSHEAVVWLKELKDAIYDADDLVDEFVTLAAQKQLVEDGRACKEAHLFFSRFDPVNVADYMAHRVKKIREKLDVSASENDQFGFDVDYLSVRRRKPEGNCSYVYENDVIGRETDLSNVIGVLLDSTVMDDVSVLSIMGVGGVGKTALARLVYNDERVVKAFSLRLWTCVSDQDQEEFNVDEIIRKIVGSATDQKHYDSETNQVHDQLMEHIEGRKYLLVLDDVWTENREQWLKLVQVLKVGQRGSRIIVTTRSRKTATETISVGSTYELQGLSEENSLHLFEKTAFEGATPSDNLVEIGQQIVKVCDNIPLAIRVVGSLLYGQDESQWASFQESGLARIGLGKDEISPILKLSYDHLEPALQSCFSYCALFPRDYKIQKDMLISIWISQGFIVPLDECQSMEDAGEEYFSILLQRCFFQDVKKDEYGEIVSCKIHDLMHDFARELAGEEISAVDAGAKSRVRTYFEVGRKNQIPLNQLVENYISLRTLVMRDSDIKTLPDSIDKLLHLRCLDLSDNSSLEFLPNSVMNLHNLQTLRLRSCINLKELPKNLSKLSKLQVLDIAYCYRLAFVPSDLHKLTSLHTLSDYKVCVTSSSSSQCFDQLEGLKSLVNLKGGLWIKLWFCTNAAYVKEDGREGVYMKNKEHLKHVRFDIQHSQGDTVGDYEMALLEDLQPHSNLKGVVFSGYDSMRFPSWVRDDNLSTFIPNLVRLEFVRCKKLQFLPCLRKLHHLKFLSLFDLPNLEYLETSSSGFGEEVQIVYPCLEEFRLSGLLKLKGFRKETVEDDVSGDSSTSTRRQRKTKTRVNTRKSRRLPFSLYLPQLKSLQIRECLELTSTILCPRVEEMILRVFNRKLTVKTTSEHENQRYAKLQSVIIDNIAWLNLLPTETFQCLSHICIFWDKELESLSEVEDIFRSCSSSLRNLEICHCPKLKCISAGLKHLTVLETLVLEYIANLRLTSSEKEEREQDGTPWRSLHQSLRSLELSSLPNVVNLPKGMQFLTSLRSLKIWDCQEMKSMPKWIPELVSLKRLDVQGCPHLCERYENLMEKDWPNTEHIPGVSVRW
ncbi:hypothetical protein RND81_14G131000 [Saponaria officinalis]|uniref:Uncharacterized protein n=1 Tax=Saponaria officinalis TaxID=3572 RepID=A0AAW1GML6_SAPOF